MTEFQWKYVISIFILVVVILVIFLIMSRLSSSPEITKPLLTPIM